MASFVAFSGANVAAKTRCPRRSVVVRASAEPSSRRQLLGLGALFAAAVAVPAAKADLTEDLLAASKANKELNDKKRKATSYANLARSRTVTDGTCRFPENFAGCEGVEAFTGSVKYISEDTKVECQGKGKADCASRLTF